MIRFFKEVKMKFCIGLLTGALVSWLFTADHYGHIYRGDTIAGIMCRVYGYDAVRIGGWDEEETVCIDLSRATPEDDLWGEYWRTLHSNWSYPQ